MKQECKAVIFDLDGVITSTATAHENAWKALFDEYLKKKEGTKFKEFTPEDYLKYVDGKPRYDGVQSFLQSRNIKLPRGKPNDEAGKETICGLGNKKNEHYHEIIKKNRPHVFSSTIRLINELRKAGIKTAVASSSKNTKLILKTTKLTEKFDKIVDGTTLEELGLPGKPAPDLFLLAAKRLGVKPAQAVVVEDARSGVQAASRGNFGLVLGVDRHHQGLPAADITIADMKNVDAKKIKRWFEKGIEKNAWKLTYKDYQEGQQRHREALTVVGNGYLGVRGAHETTKSNETHNPATYLAGIYNELKTPMGGKNAKNNDLVCCPDWTHMQLCIGKDVIRPLEQEIIEYEHTLDMRKAATRYEMIIKDHKGRITKIASERYTSMHDMHRTGITYEITPKNHEEKITITSTLQADVRNNNVARYRQLRNKHLKTTKNYRNKEGILVLETKTNKSGYIISYAAQNKTKNKHQKRIEKGKEYIGETLSFTTKKNKKITVEKTVSIYTSNDTKTPTKKAMTDNKRFTNTAEKKKHEAAWEKIWEETTIQLKGDRFSQRTLRLHTYHLLCTASPHNIHLDAGMPARGLHGESYRGHIFWDEIYTQPFYENHYPEIARSLLHYRLNRLQQAQWLAREQGRDGACYPWQSADSGKEETQEIHYNPASGTWGADLSRNQRHVNIAVYYNHYRHYKKTGDKAYLINHALPVMINITRYLASMTNYERTKDKYHINGVMGPDEFHEKYPKSHKAGINDNSYTNAMTSWLLLETRKLIEELGTRIRTRISVAKEEIDKWNYIAHRLHIPTHKGVVEQFEGYHKLKTIDFATYKKKYGSIGRMDRILKAEGKNPDDYQVSKQADFLMLYYLLGIDEATNVLRRLGVKISDKRAFLKKNYEHHIKRTTHGSTLSYFVHDKVAGQFGTAKDAWKWFDEALRADVEDTQGGTTPEGIHTGLMAGTLNVVIEDFAGIVFAEEDIIMYPKLPKHWEAITLRIHHRAAMYEFYLDHKKVEVTMRHAPQRTIWVKGKKYTLKQGKKKIMRV